MGVKPITRDHFLQRYLEAKAAEQTARERAEQIRRGER